MTIWLLALLLFGIVGALGRQIGGIRMGVSLLGALVALFVAGPLSPVVRMALGAAGFNNPVTTWALGAPLAFLAILMIFNSSAVGVYLKISGYYKHRATDDIRMRWERIDSGMGLAAGLLAAVVYLIAASAYVYHVGYYTRQVESPTDNPIWLKLVNKMRDDLSSSKFDRVAAGVGQASPTFFQTADVIGLLYHNPELQARLPEYPLFMSLAEHGDFQSAFTNDTVRALLTTKTNIAFVLKDPTGQPMITHPETLRVLKQLDLADLTKFLQTGESEQFAKEPLIGKWQADANGTLKQYTQRNPKASPNEITRLRSILRFFFSDYTLTITPDEKVYVKGRRDPVAFAALLNPLYRPVNLPTNAPTKTVFQGTWKKDGDKYQFTLTTPQGDKTADVNLVDGGKLATVIGPNGLVFSRTE
ncbi:MAG: hypothetical protein RL514_3130 [Verrucomicrobiota bacterium]|jgi:hypothetical protein